MSDSVADELELRFLGNPDAKPPVPGNPEEARIFVRQLLVNNNDGKVPREKIKDESYYPPYDKLPPGWRITTITGTENAYGIDEGYNARSLPVAA